MGGSKELNKVWEEGTVVTDRCQDDKLHTSQKRKNGCGNQYLCQRLSLDYYLSDKLKATLIGKHISYVSSYLEV